jgi:hypothetical protein
MLLCSVGLIFILSSFFFSFINTDESIFIDFDQMLSPEQKNIYREIIKERIHIYITGSILGLLLSILYYLFVKEKYSVCTSVVIFYVVQLLYYKMSSKHPLMLYYLTTREQVDQWADIYLYMKQRWNVSFLLAFIGYILLAFSFSTFPLTL